MSNGPPRKGVIYITQIEMSMADSLADMLNSGKAWVHMDEETNRPVLYVNDGEKRYCVKKVQVFDKESKQLATQWVNLGEAPAKKQAAAADPAVVQAIKELMAEGKLPSTK